MQMRAGGAAGHADFADFLSGLHVFANFDANAAEMIEHADQALAVIQKNSIAVEKIISRFDHRARERR